MSRKDFDEACAAVDYQLSFRRSPIRRSFHDGGLDGPSLDDAFRPGRTSPGEWDVPDWSFDADDSGRSRDEWIAEFFAVAIVEAAHEVMEWFRVGDSCYINPHGDGEPGIMDTCTRLAYELVGTYGPNARGAE